MKSELPGERIKFVDRGTLTVFPAPAETANGCAVVICPGGGYNILAWPKEGLEVAECPDAPHSDELQRTLA